MKPVSFKLASALAGAVLLAGCAGIRDHRGHVVDKELISSVQVGVDNKESVAGTLGRPTFVGQFNPNEWYYVSRDTSTWAFRSPKVTDQTVLRVRFDAKGNVAAVEQTGKERIAAIDPASGKTKTLGRERSFLEELFGNIGTVSQGNPAGSSGPPR